jgi:hypothetical protein
LQTLLQPSHLGIKFQYLVLAKGAASHVQLSGLRFARPAQPSLSPHALHQHRRQP